MTTKLLLGALMVLPMMAQAEKNADAGFDRLKSNVENARANAEDYQKNLGIVDKNISEVVRARAKVEDQKKQIATAAKDNRASLNKLEKEEAELAALAKDEQSKIALEEKKIQEMDAMIATMKANRANREANIQAYQSQIQQIKADKQSWVDRDKTFTEQLAQTNQHSKTLAASENEWRNKKKGYEGEVARWNKEADKEQKMLKQFQSLADSK